MRKNIITIILCVICLIPAPAVASRLTDSIRSFLAVKEARNMDRHQALNFGTEEDPKYVILNGIGTDVLDKQSTIPDDMLSSFRAGTSPSWVLQAFSGCSNQCGVGVRTAEYACRYSGGDPGTCSETQPAPETESCQEFASCSSCVAVRDGGGPDGVYALSDGRSVFCRQSVSGGGWELIAQFSNIATTRFAGMNIIRGGTEFFAIGGTKNCWVYLNTTCDSYGCTLTTTEGLNWGIGGSPVGYIRLPLPPDKTDLYVGYQDANANPNHVRCQINRDNTVLIQGPLLSDGASAEWTVTYGGGNGLSLYCWEDMSVGEIRYVFAR